MGADPAGPGADSRLDDRTQRQYRKFIAGELRSAAIYRSLAKLESDPERAALFRRLATDELEHATRWAELLGQESSDLRPGGLGPGSLVLQLAARMFGTARVAGFMIRGKQRRVYEYSEVDQARDMAAEKIAQSRVLRRLATGDLEGDVPHPEGGFLSGRGGNLRAAVLGINDGLVSNLSLVMGVAGGTEGVDFVIIAGIAGLAAGAFSMAAGEYISMRSQRDVHENLIRQERAELELWPEEEEAELAAIYQQKGLTEAEAGVVASRIMAQPEVALDTHIREELGLDPEDLGSPVGAAISSFIAFTLGAIVPIIPFLFMDGSLTLPLSALLSAAALVIVGSGLAWVSGVTPIRGSLRMLLIGGAAAAVTFAIGTAVGEAV